MKGLPLFFFLLLASWQAASAADSTFPSPPYPPTAWRHHETGTIQLSITFGRDQEVSDCHVVHSSAPYLLDTYTCDFIQKNWRSSAYAGTTISVPITYTMPGVAPISVDFPAPPYFTSDAEEGSVTLAVNFGPDGWVKNCTVAKSSGYLHLDSMALAWVKTHWHHNAYAGQTINVPFVFKKPQAPST